MSASVVAPDIIIHSENKEYNELATTGNANSSQQTASFRETVKFWEGGANTSTINGQLFNVTLDMIKHESVTVEDTAKLFFLLLLKVCLIFLGMLGFRCLTRSVFVRWGDSGSGYRGDRGRVSCVPCGLGKVGAPHSDGGGGCVFGALVLLLRLLQPVCWQQRAQVLHLRNVLPSGSRCVSSLCEMCRL